MIRRYLSKGQRLIDITAPTTRLTDVQAETLARAILLGVGKDLIQDNERAAAKSERDRVAARLEQLVAHLRGGQ